MPPVRKTITAPVTRCRVSEGHRSRTLSPGWKNLAMAEPMAPTPPRRPRRVIAKKEKWGSSLKLPYNTYIFLRKKGATTAQLVFFLFYAATIGPMAGARSIISSPALVIIVQINMPPVRKMICKRTLPYLTLEGWGRNPQSIANPVRIRTRSTDSYREAEYPSWY